LSVNSLYNLENPEMSQKEIVKRIHLIPEKVGYCILEAPSKEAVEKHHSKLGYKCDWVTEIRITA
jgi:hypothetical protein